MTSPERPWTGRTSSGSWSATGSVDEVFVRRILSTALLSGYALVTVCAGDEGTKMLEEFNRLLKSLIFLAAVLAVFSLVWGPLRPCAWMRDAIAMEDCGTRGQWG